MKNSIHFKWFCRNPSFVLTAVLIAAIPSALPAQMEQPPEKPARDEEKAPTDPDHGFNNFESWLAMMNNSAVHWDEPTDGTKHPQIYMTSGHDYSSPVMNRVEKWEKRVSIVISAEVDREALFEIAGNRIYYRPFRSNLPAGASGEGKIESFEGYYPVNVTVNGMRWTNLRKAFELDFNPNLKSLNGVGMESGDVLFRCHCSDGYGPSQIRLVIEVKNKGPKPASIRIDLSTTAGQKPEMETMDPADFEDDRITLEGIIDGEGTFIFEGDTIQYRHGLFDRPAAVSVNGKPWDDLSKPFKLDSQIGTERPGIMELKARNPVKLNKISDRRFELIFNDTDRSSAFYHVTVASRKKNKTK